MEIISKEDFAELVQVKKDLCISVYIPTHRAGQEVNEKQDRIVFKTTLQNLTSQLKQQNYDEAKIDRVLSPAFALVNDDAFWNTQLEGLAVYLAEDFNRVLQLPFTVQQTEYINNTFYLSPVIPAITANKSFYVLMLSKHDAKLFKGNRYGIEKVTVAGLPNGMDDVVHFEEKGDRMLHRKGGTGAGGPAGEASSYHGQGEGNPDDKENLALYFHEVDKTIFAEVLHDKHEPLIIAAVDYLVPIYKQASKYNNIYSESLSGNFEHENSATLFTKALEKLAPYFQEDTKKALKNYYNQLATAQSSSMPETVIPASYYARISDLFIAEGQHIWGTFDEQNNKLTMHAEKQDGDEDLIDRAAVNTYLNGGSVNILDAEHMPRESVVAAYMRY